MRRKKKEKATNVCTGSSWFDEKLLSSIAISERARERESEEKWKVLKDFVSRCYSAIAKNTRADENAVKWMGENRTRLHACSRNESRDIQWNGFGMEMD